MPGKKWSFFENGMPGLHLTINPQKPLPAEAHVVQQFANQGITLNDRERESILRGRGEGVGTVKTILDSLIPGFAPDKRLKFANQIVDALLTMQALKLTDPQAREALLGLHGRIYALGLVHQQLMGSADLKTFDIAPFLRELSDNLLQAGADAPVKLQSPTVVTPEARHSAAPRRAIASISGTPMRALRSMCTRIQRANGSPSPKPA